MDYIQEAIGNTTKGIITCGSIPGYEGTTKISLDELIVYIENINENLTNQKKITLPCIIKEGKLIGRASTSNYREDVYIIEFSESPRFTKLPQDKLYKTLLEYVNQIGKHMKQERMYLEFDGQTEVFKYQNS